jgi:hypothetical protein
MAFERPWADVHPQGALFVGASLADQAEHFALALRQRLLPGLRREHHPRGATAILASAGLALAFRFVIGLGGRPGRVRYLLHHGADAFGLLERVLHHLLQIDAIAGCLGKLMAVLLDLVHVEQQRCQRPVQFGAIAAPASSAARARAADSCKISRLSSRGVMVAIHFEKYESPAR